MTKFRHGLAILTAAFLAGGAYGEDIAYWSYAGPTGPAHWGNIDKNFSSCESGRAGSPVNITSAVKAPADMPHIRFQYGPNRMHLLNTGHAIEFVAQHGGGAVSLGDERYELVQFHFHAPGEERFAGKASPLDMHIVHADASGKLLVIAVQFMPGDANPVLDAMLNQIPTRPGEEKVIDSVQIDPSALLPMKLSYYTYSGSLTTPPCSEGVIWIELKQPVSVSPRQLNAMRKLYSHNQRPVQPLNGREVLEVGP